MDRLSNPADHTLVDEVLVDEFAGQFRDASLCQLNSVVAALLMWATEQPAAHGLDQLRVWRDRIEVCRSQIVAREQDAGTTGSGLDRLLGRKTTTRADRNRARKRADTLSRNRELADEVDAGRLTADQLDAICDADAKTDGKAANDPDLLADIAAAPADAARKAADAFVKAQQSADDREARRRDQRKRRGVHKTTTADGLASLTISGDDESVHQMWTRIIDTADAMYRTDGGRDLAAGSHPRTDHQRRFDAALQHLTQTAAVTSAAAGPVPVIVVSAAKLAGHSHEPAELVGSGPIPDSYLEELACCSDFVGTIFDSHGQVLWHGRKRRHATEAQHEALAARDRGCVLCGADPPRCHAHHLIPWSAPGKGTTDIDNLALMCGTCHRQLHNTNYTLYRDADDRWKTRPATGAETPETRTIRAGGPPTSHPTPPHHQERTSITHA